MSESYAVVWREGDGPRQVGKLEVHQDGVHLSGGTGPRHADRVLAPGTITGVHVQQPGTGPLGDMRTLVVDRDQATPITIATLNGIGIVLEIADVVTEIARRPARGSASVAVRVPIRKQRADKVRDLVRKGPPFQPSSIHGLARHHVFVNDAEAVFIFEGANVGEAVERLIQRPQVWLAATDWHDCLAGRPTVLPCKYTWSRPPAPDNERPYRRRP
jgi:hypothetical protein